MGNELPILKVKLFGKERITYGDVPIWFERNSITKAVKILIILLHSGKSGIARNKLLEDLYGREELANVGNSLRVTVHRLKKMLVDAGFPEHEYIVSRGGIYYWDSPMEVEVDTQMFKNLIEKAQGAEGEEKIALLREACLLYSGEFLQKLSGDEWVLLEGIQYKKMYTEALQQISSYLMDQKEYKEAIQVVDAACEIYPFDEWQSVKIDCYIAMNRYKDALKEYENTARLLIEELGVSPSEKMLEQFKIMSSHISNRPQIISEIKGGLQEETEERGAFFCTFPSFRDTYRVIRRGMERTGQSVFLLVCTLTDKKGRPMESGEKLDELSDCLFDAIKMSLRRCDSFTKYNQAQYLVMLMGTNEENCQIVVDRITKNYTKEHKSWAQYLECHVTSLYELKTQEEKLRFH